MNYQLIFGYWGAFAVGLILGLLGGGGALMSIPVLVYIFKIEPVVATGYSLFIVGITALAGTFRNIKKQLVDYQVALHYGIPSVFSIFITRRFIVPAIPAVIANIGGFVLTKNIFILVLLSVFMVIAGVKMIQDKKRVAEEGSGYNLLYMLVWAISIGFFLGLTGAGGGFLMIPALYYFANLPMKKAVGTSLVIVAANSFIGFLGELHPGNTIDWNFLFIFTSFAVVGIFIGTYLTNFIEGEKLKKYFGVFMLLIAAYIISKELFKV